MFPGAPWRSWCYYRRPRSTASAIWLCLKSCNTLRKKITLLMIRTEIKGWLLFFNGSYYDVLCRRMQTIKPICFPGVRSLLLFFFLRILERKYLRKIGTTNIWPFSFFFPDTSMLLFCLISGIISHTQL